MKHKFFVILLCIPIQYVDAMSNNQFSGDQLRELILQKVSNQQKIVNPKKSEPYKYKKQKNDRCYLPDMPIEIYKKILTDATFYQNHHKITKGWISFSEQSSYFLHKNDEEKLALNQNLNILEPVKIVYTDSIPNNPYGDAILAQPDQICNFPIQLHWSKENIRLDNDYTGDANIIRWSNVGCSYNNVTTIMHDGVNKDNNSLFVVNLKDPHLANSNKRSSFKKKSCTHNLCFVALENKNEQKPFLNNQKRLNYIHHKLPGICTAIALNYWNNKAAISSFDPKKKKNTLQVYDFDTIVSDQGYNHICFHDFAWYDDTNYYWSTELPTQFKKLFWISQNTAMALSWDHRIYIAALSKQGIIETYQQKFTYTNGKECFIKKIAGNSHDDFVFFLDTYNNLFIANTRKRGNEQFTFSQIKAKQKNISEIWLDHNKLGIEEKPTIIETPEGFVRRKKLTIETIDFIKQIDTTH